MNTPGNGSAGRAMTFAHVAMRSVHTVLSYVVYMCFGKSSEVLMSSPWLVCWICLGLVNVA